MIKYFKKGLASPGLLKLTSKELNAKKLFNFKAFLFCTVLIVIFAYFGTTISSKGGGLMKIFVVFLIGGMGEFGLTLYSIHREIKRRKRK